jgi:hypothetical protein
VLWNWHAPSLWNRFIIELARVLAGRHGLSERAWRMLVRIAYAKVAEFQARGLVHFHAIIRLDGAEDRAAAPGVDVTPEQLCDAIHDAAGRARIDGGDSQTADMRFGEQLHTRAMAVAEDGRELNPGQVAAYVAKYSCKASHERITTRDTDPDRWRDRGVPEQLVQMAAAALRLTERQGLRNLGEWVHMLGFRGHFVTKSRGYSTTLGELRAARAAYRACQDKHPTTPKSMTMTRRSSCASGSTSARATSTPATCSWQPASRHPYGQPAKRCLICADHRKRAPSDPTA